MSNSHNSSEFTARLPIKLDFELSYLRMMMYGAVSLLMVVVRPVRALIGEASRSNGPQPWPAQCGSCARWPCGGATQ